MSYIVVVVSHYFTFCKISLSPTKADVLSLNIFFVFVLV